jgi:hypothetical protein
MTKPTDPLKSSTPVTPVFFLDPKQDLQAKTLKANRQPIKDTIETAPAETLGSPSFKPSKPCLSPELRVINASDRLYKTGENQLQLNADSLSQEQKDLEELCRTHFKKMSKAAELSQEQGVWSYLQRTGAYVLSAVSIYLGFATATSATLVGGVLVGAGIMTLANIVLTDAGFWDWVVEKIASDNDEQQKRYRDFVTIAAFSVIGAQLFAVGSVAVFGTFSVAAVAVPIAQLAFTLATTLSGVTGQVSQARVNWSHAELTELQGKLSASQHKIGHITDELEETLKQKQQTFRSAKNVLDLALEARRTAISEF